MDNGITTPWLGPLKAIVDGILLRPEDDITRAGGSTRACADYKGKNTAQQQPHLHTAPSSWALQSVSWAVAGAHARAASVTRRAALTLRCAAIFEDFNT